MNSNGGPSLLPNPQSPIRNPQSAWGGVRESDPLFELHKLACARHTHATAYPLRIGDLGLRIRRQRHASPWSPNPQSATRIPQSEWSEQPDSNRRPPGSEPGARTRCAMLRLTLLPHFAWSERPDSNRRPPGPQPGAFIRCATLRLPFAGRTGRSRTFTGRVSGGHADRYTTVRMVGAAGLEPAIPWSQTRRVASTLRPNASWPLDSSSRAGGAS